MDTQLSEDGPRGARLLRPQAPRFRLRTIVARSRRQEGVYMVQELSTGWRSPKMGWKWALRAYNAGLLYSALQFEGQHPDEFAHPGWHMTPFLAGENAKQADRAWDTFCRTLESSCE